MSIPQTGLTADTKKYLVLDAAVMYELTDAQLTALETALGTGTGIDTALAAGKLLGATKGGATVTLSDSWRQIQVDGVRGRIAGFDRLDDVNGTVQTNLLEWSAENLERLFTQADASDLGTPAAYRKISGDTSKAPAYLPNLVIQGNTQNPATPLFIVLKKAICTAKGNFSFQDKNEAVIQATFEARFDPANPSVYPYTIYTPIPAA
ncbi:hypothetical protein [Meiothermus granaticius]|uniref:Phage major tail protein, phi13 family n=1 Tax=Meiothermus granaticius NBRC 107808 TaxID=1227551 RepID=A0A399FCK8_9DEIN|nr:hypothetical protein [Meiothermus granaticius]RIH93988.1 hypothetical protein Mgrana_00074 [Meiothermus granaticius NBRC 107808]GEM88183.1 hypothetical protein MGR01S_28080 [Meiothermus granaticius NBRC 107808]